MANEVIQNMFITQTEDVLSMSLGIHTYHHHMTTTMTTTTPTNNNR